MKMGMNFYPCSSDFESFKETWKQSEFYLENDFFKKFHYHVSAAQHITECAKIYIMENWKKVTDWTNIIISFYHREEDKDYYFCPERKHIEGKTRSKVIERITNEWKPLNGFDDIVLDPTDGDLSVTVNGKEFLFIDAEAVITIANYIEKFLTSNI